MRWSRRVLLGTVALLMLTLVLLIGGLWVAAGTEWGTRQVVDRVLPLLPGEFAAEVEGHLLGRLKVLNLSYRTESMQVEVKRFELHWRPSALLDRLVHVDRLEASGVRVHTQPSEAPPEDDTPFELPELRLPIRVALERVALDDVAIRSGAAEPVVIDEALLVARYDADGLRIHELRVQAPQGRVELAGGVEPWGSYPLDAELRWQAPVPDIGEARGVATLSGAVGEQLRLQHRLEAPAVARLQVQVEDLFGTLRWSLDLEIDETVPANLRADLPAWPMQLRLDGGGTIEDFELSGDYSARETPYGALDGVLRVQREGELIRLTQLRLAPVRSGDAPPPVDSAAQLAVTGDATLRLGDTPQAEARLDWHGVEWPPGEAQYTSGRGELEFSGWLDGFTAHLEAAAGGVQVPSGDWVLDARGDQQSLESFTLRGSTLDGKIEARGTAGWAEQPRWDVQLSASGIDPGQQWPQWPGDVNLQLASRGQVQSAGVSARVDLKSLSGTLREQRLAGRVQADYSPQALMLEEVDLAFGEARLEAAGQALDRFDLRFDLDVPDLAALWPDGAGRVSAKGTLEGSAEAPVVIADLSAQRLQVGDIEVPELSGDVNVDFLGDGRMDISLSGRDIFAAGTLIERLQLQTRGRPSAHRLSLELRAGERALDLVAEGGTDLKGWAGELQQLGVQSPQSGRWALEAPAALSADAEAARLAPACLTADAGRLCLEGDWSAAGGWQAEVRAPRVELALANAFLDESRRLNGGLSLNAALQGGGGPITGTVQLDLEPGTLTADLPDQPPIELGYRGGSVNADLDANRVLAQLSLLPGRSGDQRIGAEVRLPPLPFAEAPQAAALAGSITAQLDDFSAIPLLVPAVDAFAGRLSVDLDLGGTLGRPAVTGQLALTEGEAGIVPAGLDLEDIELRVDAAGSERLGLELSVRSGEGNLSATGELRPDPDAGFPFSIDIEGERFEAVDLPEMWALISPDLQLSGTAQAVKLRGELVVPEAEISPPKSSGQSSPDLVATSSDVVVLTDEPAQDGEAAEAFSLDTELRLTMGDKVHLSGYGFEGRLTGSILVRDEPGAETTATGNLAVADGIYQAYGQDLQIQRGRVIFAGGPIANPGLDVRAVRETDDVIAGVRVRGRAQSPTLQLFSEPSLPEDQILSYLLLGRPLGQASSAEGSMLARASTALGLSGGERLAQRIGSKLGLDEVSIEGKGDAGETSLALGKYLSPRLYVGYGLGLFDAANALTMRYTMTDNWVLQVLSGDQQYVDLLYTLER